MPYSVMNEISEQAIMASPRSFRSTQTTQFGLLLGATIIVFTGALLLVSSIFLLIGNRIEWYYILLAAILSVLFCWWGAGYYFPKARQRMFLTTSAYAIGFVVVFTLLSGLVYDTSWDGQNYQSEAILQLADGWNPFYAPPNNTIYPEFLQFFSKGPWINAAAVYKLTGNFEQGKVFHGLLMQSAFLLCMAAFSTYRMLRLRWILVLSTLMAFNPVSLSQMFTFYVDGLLSSMLIIMICLFILLYRYPGRILMVTLASTLIIVVNIKLSGAIYAGILGMSYGLWYFLHKKPHRIELIIWLVAGLLLGTILVGYNPYITQYASKYVSSGNPFDPYDMKTFIHLDYNSPGNFVNLGWGEKLLTSLFSRSQSTSVPSQMKWPLSVSLEEILAFSAPDVRVGGFGPMFGGALLLSVGLLVTALAKYWRKLFPFSFLLFLLATVLISSLSNSEAWWARYVPQLWVLPIMTIWLVMIAIPHGKLRRLSQLIIIILCVNQLLIAPPVIINAISQSIEHTQQLAQLKNTDRKILVNFNYFVGTEFRFKEWDIDYQVVDELPCDTTQQIRIVGSETRVCLQ